MDKIEYDNLYPELQDILTNYCDVLNISMDVAMKILNINKTVQLFLPARVWVIMHGKEESLRLFIKLTLCREESNVFYPLTQEEKGLLKQYYNIEIK